MHRRMIERAQIQNIRSIRAVDFELSELTIFVGPNGAGKSTLLDAFDPTLEFFVEDESVLTLLFVDGAYFQRDSDQENLPLIERLRYQKLRLSPDALRAPNVPCAERRLARDGSNLTNVFASLTRTRQAAVAARFCELVPIFSDVDIEPTDGGMLRLRFHDRWKSDRFHSPAQVCDGALVLFAYLVLPHQGEPADLVAIEEPERGLHPYLLDELLRHLRAVSKADGVDRPMQFLLATHSVSLLDLARAEEVRFVDRRPDTGATFVRTPPRDREKWEKTRELYKESMGAPWAFGS